MKGTLVFVNRKFLVLFALLIVMINGCCHKPIVIGIYTGILPCKDCESIQTMVKLNVDHTFEMENILNGKPDEIMHYRGTYESRRAGKEIFLRSANADTLFSKLPDIYEVTGNDLIAKGVDPKADKFLLHKSENSILEKYWKLVKLNGKDLTGPSDSTREAHLVIKFLQNRVLGSGGCNRFSGACHVTEAGKIFFTDLISTKMACMDIDYEQEFLNDLEIVDHYLIKNDTLILMKNEEVLAKFKNLQR